MLNVTEINTSNSMLTPVPSISIIYLYDQVLHNINTLITYNYIWFAATCFDVNTSFSGSLLCLAKITYIVDIDKMELLK